MYIMLSQQAAHSSFISLGPRSADNSLNCTVNHNKAIINIIIIIIIITIIIIIFIMLFYYCDHHYYPPQNKKKHIKQKHIGGLKQH